MKSPIYLLGGPVSALELETGRTTTMCPRCHRGFTRQTGSLSVQLTDATKLVFLGSSSAVLIPEHLLPEIKGYFIETVTVLPVTACWYEGIDGHNAPAPSMYQVLPTGQVAAAEQSISRSNCTCRAVKRIDLARLVVRCPSDSRGLRIARLADNPIVTVVDTPTREFLLGLDQTLEFTRAYCEGEEVPPIGPTFEGISWSDL